MGRFVTNHGTFSSNYFFRSLIPFFASLYGLTWRVYGKWQKIGIITSFLLLLKSSRKSLRADIRVEASARICEDGLHKYTYIKYSFA